MALVVPLTFHSIKFQHDLLIKKKKALNINIDPRSVPSTSTDTSIPANSDQIAATALEYTNIVTPAVHAPGTEPEEAAPSQPENSDNIVPQSQAHEHDKPEQESPSTYTDLKITELSPEEIAKIMNNQPSICLTSSVSKLVRDKETTTGVDQHNYIINNQPRVHIECYIPPFDPGNDSTKKLKPERCSTKSRLASDVFPTKENAKWSIIGH